MNISAYIAKKIAFQRQQSYSKFIIRLAVAATALCVAGLIVTLAFVNGFDYVIQNKIFSVWGHVRIQHFGEIQSSIAEETPIQKNETVIQDLRNLEGIVSISPYANKSVLLKSKYSLEGVLLKGVEYNYDFNPLQSFLEEGKWISFSDTAYSREINITQSIADNLDVKVDDSLIIYFLQSDDRPRARKVKVAGIFKTGIDIYDKNIAFGDLRLIRRLNNWNENQIGGYEIHLNDYKEMDKMNLSIKEILPIDLGSRTIKKSDPYIFDWLELQHRTKWIAIVIVSVLAFINIITCLLILVLDRTNMIGILKASGATDFTIQKIFLYHGTLISLYGSIIGLIVGLIICWVQSNYPFISLNEEAYFIKTIPVKIIWWQNAIVIAGAILLCYIILLIPSLLVKRISPVKAIRFE